MTPPPEPFPDETARRVVGAAARRFRGLCERLRVLDYEDLVQEGFLELWRRKDSHPAVLSDVGLAHVAARNAMLKAVRAARGSGRRDDPDAGPDQGLHRFDPARTDTDPDAPLDVADAVARLSAGLASAARHRLAGLPTRDAARLDRVPVKTADTRWRRARAALQSSLAAYGPADTPIKAASASASSPSPRNADSLSNAPANTASPLLIATDPAAANAHATSSGGTGGTESPARRTTVSRSAATQRHPHGSGNPGNPHHAANGSTESSTRNT